MAKYRGKGKVQEIIDDLNKTVSSGRTRVSNLEKLANGTEDDKKELREKLNTLFKLTNQQIKRVQRSGYYSPAMDDLGKTNKFSAVGKSGNELVTHVRKAINFNLDPTSRPSILKKMSKKFSEGFELLTKQGDKRGILLTDMQEEILFRAFKKLKEVHNTDIEKSMGGTNWSIIADVVLQLGGRTVDEAFQSLEKFYYDTEPSPLNETPQERIYRLSNEKIYKSKNRK